MAFAVEARGLGFRYREGDRWIFRGLSFSIPYGSILALTGRSGSGKSSLLRILAGLITPCEGIVRLGSDIAPSTAMMFQEPRLLPWRRIVENVALGCENQGISRRDRRSRAQDAINIVGLGKLASRYPHQLSGGQQQRVALARAVVSHAPLLLLDEPFSAIDSVTRGEMLSLLHTLRDNGKTVVLVTHTASDIVQLNADQLNADELNLEHQESGCSRIASA